jgi:Dolichyl-phosphate-mannose-protein mannosyltransferase
VSEAYGWASGTLPHAVPMPLDLPFPYSEPMQAPLGYRVGPQPHTMVPTYAPGFPLMMAMALVAGPCGPFFVVPLCGAMFIWCTYRLGERAAGAVNGVIAALVAAGSPVVLYQNLIPMSDVPAAAFWTAGLLFSLRPRWRHAIVAALCTAMGVLIRPNLVALSAIPLLQVLLTTRGRERWVRGAVFCVPIAVVALAIAWLNTLWFGAPSNTGYGPPSELYKWSNVWPNVKLYGSWLWQSESPGVLIALAALVPALTRQADRAVIRICALMCLATFVCYVSYSQFDVWWYLRFLLPAGGAFAVLIATGFTSVARAFPRPYGQAAAAAALVVSLAARISFAEDKGSFGSMRAGERRYIDIGEFVEANLPGNAALFSMQHSGSLRFYSGRLTLRYDWVQKEWARDVPGAVERAGYHPYLAIDDWEAADVRKQWGLPENQPLPWPVRAHMRELGGVTLFDLATNPGSVSPVALEPGSKHWCSALRPLRR